MGQLCNYPPKGRWIVVDIHRDARHRGIYLVLWTHPAWGDSCFNIYQISWIKIKKELFVNKRCQLVTVCVCFNWQCFGNHFYDLVAYSVRLFFLPTSKCRQAKFCLFLRIVGEAASFTDKIWSFETVAKREAILNPLSKQWISKDIPSYGSQSECAKIAIHWFGEY